MPTKKILLLVVSFLVSYSLSAQDKERFEKIFEKETSNDNSPYKKFKNVKKFSFYPDTLPAWFFEPKLFAGNYYAIGVSDPDMELSQAKELAILRAKSMALLAEECNVQYFKDIYTSAEEVQRYTNLKERFDIYFKLTAKRKVAESMFEVLDTHFTKYNEYAVLVSYNPKNVSENDTLYPMLTNATAFFVQASFDDIEENQGEYEGKNYVAFPNENVQASEFLFREKGSRFLSISRYNGETLEFPAYSYTYAMPGASSRKQVLVTFNGLWSLLSRQLLVSLILNVQPYSIKLKNVNQENDKGIVRLAREIASFDSQLEINGINFVNDTLKFDLNLKGQQNSIW
ncbi:hypothetical protein [Tenuifilum thalassicum]|uniref:Uncharacterized protein n=1 Tax=Tenuifilum thalassicum TaxID=2590900 RepID=A0A7D4AYA4_9BACT|nr:hypothetical protein [Tenuifilum thalassicum]QKG80774.1 hypothetical protein FHG85_11030 [Tenuifilum thalassicum]